MSRSHAQKEFSFLKTLIDEELEHQQENRDSDKENEASLNITLSKSDAVQQVQKTEMKMEKLSETYEYGKSVDIEKGNNERNVNIWEDFLTDDEVNDIIESKEIQKEEFSHKKCDSLEMEKDTEEIVLMAEVRGGHDEFEQKNDIKNEKYNGRKIKKQLFKQVTRPKRSVPRTTSVSQPDLVLHDRHYNDVNFETMSETTGRHGRRLKKRLQVSRPKCAGPEPSGDILQQKIQELHALMLKPLTEPKQYIHQTRQELLRFKEVSQHQDVHIIDGSHHWNEPLGRQSKQAFVELPTENSDVGYSVLRAAQLREDKPHRPRSAVKMNHQTISDKDHRDRSFSAGHRMNNKFHTSTENRYGYHDNGVRGRRLDKNKENKGDSVRSNSESVQSNDSVRKNNSEIHKKEHESKISSPVRSIFQSDTHLKNSANPALRKWLRIKNKEFRKNKVEERKKLKAEIAKKEEDAKAKQEMFKDSEEKVKTWMTQKRKEMRKTEKLKRQIMRKEKLRLDSEKRIDGLNTSDLKELSVSGQAHQDNKFISVSRSKTSHEETTEVKEQKCEGDVPSADTPSPKPPTTKFVYRRPVSGYVRLMKVQQRRIEDSKKSEQEKKLLEEKLSREKSMKIRISYDQWLLKKRKDDYARRQEIAKQKALAKSDPELDRILPEVARRRIENLQRGRKRIETGNNVLNEEVNKLFGGGEFQTDTKTESVQTNHKIEVSGQQKIIKQRPSTAKSISHKKYFSKHTSAQFHAQSSLSSESIGGSSEPNPFKLPFPPEHGAPKYVISTQRRIFATNLTESTSVLSESPCQQTEVTGATVDRLMKPATKLYTEPSMIYGNTDSQVNNDSSSDDIKFDGVKWVMPADNVKSFFITDGNLANVEQYETVENNDKADDDFSSG